MVAYIYGSIPITREDLGEYLIARKGLDTVELLVNKRIIEHACEVAQYHGHRRRGGCIDPGRL